MKKYFITIMSVAVLISRIFAAPSEILESERELPVVREVDVVVVGGGSAAVAAAKSAADSGVSVFLAAPRQYLGDDIAGTLRLWLQEGELSSSPLAKAIYQSNETTLDFTYDTDRPSQGKHIDKNAMLSDGRYDDVQHQSVEYADDVAVTADLGNRRGLTAVEMVAYQRKGDFEVGSMHMSVSSEGKNWSVGIPLKPKPGSQPGIVIYRAELNRSVRYMKVAVKKRAGAQRILIGELVLYASEDAVTKVIVPTPLRVKQAFDKALLDSGVQFLTGSYVTDLLVDKTGKPAGVAIANRSGRQAVIAKVVIDASERAVVARLAGATFKDWPAGPQTFTRIVIAGDEPAAERMTVSQLSGNYKVNITLGGRRNGKVDGKAYLCSMQIDMKDGSFRSFAEAEQVARDRTFVKSLLEGADTLFNVPPDTVKSRKKLSGEWPGSDNVDLACFQPEGVHRIYVLGGCADVSRDAARKMMRPLEFMKVGARVGKAAAMDTSKISKLSGVKRAGDAKGAVVRGEVKELLRGPRPFSSGLSTVKAEANGLPVLGSYDVVVIGGGTGGAPAGIGAARAGAKTLLVEQLYGLGGVGTLGMIGKYWYGNVCGFTAEHDKGVKELGTKVHVVGKREWWRRENRKAGTEIWFGALGCGTLVDNGKVIGVIVATPSGRGVVLADSVIDSTGNADIAASAGAACVFQSADEIALQGVGLSPRKLGASYINSDFGYVNDCDAVDLWLFGVRARAGAGKAWDISQVVESRERQRIVGDYWVTPLDILNRRTFPDTILQARSNFDSHGYSVADICYVSEPTDTKIFMANVPYRCMLPKGIEGLIVTGLGMSAHRDSMPIMRMQPDIQNQGYVAGLAGATAVREGRTFRTIDVHELQKQLVKDGIIPKAVLGWKDNAVVGMERLATAVKNMGDGYKDISLVLAQRDESLPLLRNAYRKTQKDTSKLIYAHVLGIMGDPAGVETLAGIVSRKVPVPEMNLKGERTFGKRVTEMDSYIIALGRTGDKRAVAPVVELVRKMDARSRFSKFRAVTLALEALADPAAAEALAELLQKPGIAGHAMTDVKDAKPAGGFGAIGTGNERNLCLRELAVARALYRCGDYKGLAEKTFQTYAKDLRGVYALHATEVLKSGK
jgi:ribulose 1,5-bisphosphate synthetase/thiazole synthase